MSPGRIFLLLPLLLAACTAPASWQKPHGDDAALAKDTSECRTAAREEARRQYPPGSHGASTTGAGVMAAQQRDDTNRAIVEAASFNACMQARGYLRKP